MLAKPNNNKSLSPYQNDLYSYLSVLLIWRKTKIGVFCVNNNLF